MVKTSLDASYALWSIATACKRSDTLLGGAFFAPSPSC